MRIHAVAQRTTASLLLSRLLSACLALQGEHLPHDKAQPPAPDMYDEGGEKRSVSPDASTSANASATQNTNFDNWIVEQITPVLGPVRRIEPTAVWTGTEMIVWGGRTVSPEVPGGALAPAEGNYYYRWRLMPTEGQPSPRSCAFSTWVGGTSTDSGKMLVWGGLDPDSRSDDRQTLDNGAWFDGRSWSWKPFVQSGKPPRFARPGFCGKFFRFERVGAYVIAFGVDLLAPQYRDYVSVAAMMNIETGEWEQLPTSGMPSARCMMGTAANSTTFFVWGGRQCSMYGDGEVFADGAAFDVAMRQWRALPLDSVASSLAGEAVLSADDQELFVWIHTPHWREQAQAGGILNIASGAWRPIPIPSTHACGERCTLTRAGRYLVMVGGMEQPDEPVTGRSSTSVQVFDLEKHLWIQNSRNDISWQGIVSHAAVWTGRELLVTFGEYIEQDGVFTEFQGMRDFYSIKPVPR